MERTENAFGLVSGFWITTPLTARMSEIKSQPVDRGINEHFRPFVPNGTQAISQENEA